MAGDAPWYEAALLVGVTNALNVVADSPLESLEPPSLSAEAQATFAEIRAFYDRADVPVAFRRLAADPGYLADLWGAVRRAFADNTLTRRHKEALAFAVSVTTRSAFGTALHLGEMRRLGVGERGVMEVLGVTQMFSSYTKIADTLQLEPDMDHMVPADPSPAPGGPTPPRGNRPPQAPTRRAAAQRQSSRRVVRATARKR
ncbi:MAG: carboxymuconolactone decarboxylase family protein [Candidatus Rokuibacteriota bacterium]